MRLRFDHGPGGGMAEFAAPTRIIRAWEAADVAAALAEVDAVLAAGNWVAGYASYEAGYALEPKLAGLAPARSDIPLICFGVYDVPKPAKITAGPATIGPLMPDWDLARYTQAFDPIRAWIGAGDIYQANLTFAISATVSGTSEAIYAALMAKQPVGHGVLVEQDDLPDFLCRSPELFFELADRRITTRPMKGTIGRGATPDEDAENAAFLAADAKNRAENLMIVDLLRNDISRVSKVGTVKVPHLFAIETYATVHQMTSTIQAELLDGIGLGEILTALFPCGSITGAPKVRAMEIIRASEPAPRDIYCGTIGWAAPDGRASFNVAIRTMRVHDGQARLNVGGGIIWDSTAEAEYQEALWKSRYANTPPI